MAKLHDFRLDLLVQQELAKSKPHDEDLSIIQARCLCWLTLLAEANEEQADYSAKSGDAEQAMVWFADSIRLRDVITRVKSIEIPLPESPDLDDDTYDFDDSNQFNENYTEQSSIHIQHSIQDDFLNRKICPSTKSENQSLSHKHFCSEKKNFHNRYEKLLFLQRFMLKANKKIISKCIEIFANSLK